MTTRTFNTPEELMIALLQGEKWTLSHIRGVCMFDKTKVPNSNPFRHKTDKTDFPIGGGPYSHCDGETLWHKVEEKPKKKTVSIIKFYSSKGKILEMDKSKLTQMPKNIIDEYEIEVYYE